MRPLISYCKRCGKKVFWVPLEAGDICSSCARKEQKEKTEQRLREEKRQAEIKAQEEEEQRKRATEIYAETIALTNLPGIYDLRMKGALEDVEKYAEACDKITKNLKEATENTQFLRAYQSASQENAFHLDWYRSAEGSYIEAAIKAYGDKQKYAQEILDKSALAEKQIKEVPRAAIKRAASEFAPDEDPDFTNIKIGNVTASTSRAQLADYIVIDVETTGLSPSKNEILQIAAVKYESFAPIEAFVTYIKPKNGIDEEAQKINGITAEIVQDAPEIEEIVNSFRAFAGSKLPLVGHNIIFDLKFLCKAGCVSLKPKRKYYDTVTLAKKALKEYPPRDYKLDTLARSVLYIIRDDAHDALSDANVTGSLFDALTARITEDE